MRHNKKFNHLGRQNSHRKAMLANMSSSLIVHKRISTTVAKAKALKIYLEPLITKSKEDTTHSRRVVFSYLKDKNATAELFRVVAPKIADRPGGYTRILKTGFRLGDAADMCIIELVDFNEGYNANAPAETKARTRRSRSGGARKVEAAPVAEGVETAATDAAAKDEARKAAPKAAAKKPAAPKAAPKASPKTSGAKAVVRKSTTAKKG